MLTPADTRTATCAARAALADDLADLTDDQWSIPSLCGEWTVREVVAHLTAAATLGPLGWMWSVLRSRFDFDRHNARSLLPHLGATPADTLEAFRRIVPSTASTFGPPAAWLGEVVVHAEDIRRPLGLHHGYDLDALTGLADFFASRDFTVPGRTLSAGLRLEATDGHFGSSPARRASAGPSVPVVRGSTLALTMAMAGRPAFCADLDGDGVPVLRDRITAPAGPRTSGGGPTRR